MLSPKGFIKNIQIRQMHIVYESTVQVSRTIFFPICQIKVFLGAKQSPLLTNPIKIYDVFSLIV